MPRRKPNTETDPEAAAIDAGDESGDDVTTDAAPMAPVDEPKQPERAQAEPVSPAAPVSRFTVTLTCPTPLAENPATVEAAHEGEAQQKFCALNGISGSDHPFKIVRVAA